MWTVGFRFDCHCLRYLGGNEVTRNAYHLLWGWNSQLASYLITGMSMLVLRVLSVVTGFEYPESHENLSRGVYYLTGRFRVGG